MTKFKNPNLIEEKKNIVNPFFLVDDEMTKTL